MRRLARAVVFGLYEAAPTLTWLALLAVGLTTHLRQKILVDKQSNYPDH